MTYERRPLLAGAERVALLRKAVAEAMAKKPFQIDAAAVLPDHVHLTVTLPQDDSDYSTRIGLVKVGFTRSLSSSAPRSRSREADVWQRRYWEHTVRDDEEFEALSDYVHFNPVKHGHVSCPHAWESSSFSRWVERGWRDADWGCCCKGPKKPPDCDQFAASSPA